MNYGKHQLVSSDSAPNVSKTWTRRRLKTIPWTLSLFAVVVLSCNDASEKQLGPQISQAGVQVPQISEKTLEAIVSAVSQGEQGGHLLIHGHRFSKTAHRMVLSDASPEDGSIDYSTFGSDTKVYIQLKQRNIEFIAWRTESTGSISMASELKFLSFVHRHLTGMKNLNGWWIGRLPNVKPPARRERPIAVSGCVPKMPNGIYSWPAIQKHGGRMRPTRRVGPGMQAQMRELARVDHLIIGWTCQTQFSRKSISHFSLIGSYGGHEIWMRAQSKKRTVRQKNKWIPRRPSDPEIKQSDQPHIVRDVPEVQKPLRLLNLPESR